MACAPDARRGDAGRLVFCQPTDVEQLAPGILDGPILQLELERAPVDAHRLHELILLLEKLTEHPGHSRLHRHPDQRLDPLDLEAAHPFLGRLVELGPLLLEVRLLSDPVEVQQGHMRVTRFRVTSRVDVLLDRTADRREVTRGRLDVLLDLLVRDPYIPHELDVQVQRRVLGLRRTTNTPHLERREAAQDVGVDLRLSVETPRQVLFHLADPITELSSDATELHRHLPDDAVLQLLELRHLYGVETLLTLITRH